MVNEKELFVMLQQIIKTGIVDWVTLFIIGATIILLLKTIAEAAAGYIQIRMDKHIAIGSVIEVYGKKGRIKELSMFTITIETDCGFIRIPTKSWRTSQYFILKDRMALKNRRDADKPKEIINE